MNGNDIVGIVVGAIMCLISLCCYLQSLDCGWSKNRKRKNG